MQKLFLATITAMLISSVSVHAQGVTRDELKRADLTGTEMDVIITIVTVPPGGNLPKHTHPGEEVVYVLEGATLELPDGSQRQFPAGAATIKMLTVHIVDKGKPVTEVAK